MARPRRRGRSPTSNARILGSFGREASPGMSATIILKSLMFLDLQATNHRGDWDRSGIFFHGKRSSLLRLTSPISAGFLKLGAHLPLTNHVIKNAAPKKQLAIRVAAALATVPVDPTGIHGSHRERQTPGRFFSVIHNGLARRPTKSLAFPGWGLRRLLIRAAPFAW